MILKIKVKLHSRKAALEKVSDTEYIAHLKEPPEKGRANLQLIKLLAKELSVPQTKIKIKNPTSKEKIIEVLSK